jgi:RHS repeat-associated protein
VVTKSIEYTYDVDNQRIGKKIDGAVTERYVIDRNQIALVFDGAGTQTHRYLYGTNIDQVLADETPTNMVWALADNQGTVRDLVDNGGNVVEHLSYDSFGNLSSTTTFDFRYGYTGRERDSETGLEYYRARYYDSAVGRFVSEDPIGFAAGDSNLTRYVGNSPTNFVDPSGNVGNNINPLPGVDLNCVAQKPKRPCDGPSLSNAKTFKDFIDNARKYEQLWKNYKEPLQRAKLFKELIDPVTDSAKLPRIKVIDFDKPDKFRGKYAKDSGSYDLNNNSIYINQKKFSSSTKDFYRAAGLVYHETRHFEQLYRAMQLNNNAFIADKSLIATLKFKEFKQLPSGREQFAVDMFKWHRAYALKEPSYPNNFVERDAYAINQIMYNIFNKGKNIYKEFDLELDTVAEAGKKERPDEYKCIDSLFTK